MFDIQWQFVMMSPTVSSATATTTTTTTTTTRIERRNNSRSDGTPYRASNRFLQNVVTMFLVATTVVWWTRHSHGRHLDDMDGPVYVDKSAATTPFQQRQQPKQQQQRKINESDAHLKQKQVQQQEGVHAESKLLAATKNAPAPTTQGTKKSEEEDMMEVVIKLSSNPPPPPTPIVVMMSHSRQDGSHVLMDTVTMQLSTQIRALSNDIQVQAVLPTLSQCKATIPKSMLSQLQNDALVAYVEPNDMVFFPHNRQEQNRQKQYSQQQQQQQPNRQPSRRQPISKDTTPNGIKMAIGSNDGYGDPRRFDASTVYNTDKECSIKVGIVDSGLDVGHYDFINWCGVYDQNGMPDPNQQHQRCWGKAFLTETELENGQDWYNPFDFHGTHVAGVIAASGQNGAGVRGMVDDGNICLVIARVLGNFGGASLFQISEAITWLVDQKVRIINMSVGSPTSFTALQDAVDYAEQQGVLFVASAGNGAELKPEPYMINYPSDYPNVLSVAAVNEKDKTRGNFSNYNEYVDISAPGVDILSSIPRIGLEPVGNISSIVSANATMVNVTGIKFEYARYVNHPGVTGTLVDCGLGREVCPGPGPVGGGGGHICFMQRGEIPFIDKALNCERSGAVGAIVVNNEDDFFRGTLGFSNVTGEPYTSQIPIIGVTTKDGNSLLSAMGEKVNFYYPLVEGEAYSYQNGTSMAAPHVAGAAALIWRQCDRCTRVEVLDCLLSTAEDLGEPGRDDFYGRGLIQTDMALCCLQQEECCSQPTGAPTSTPYPSPIPTVTPVPTLSISPSTTPSSLPSSMPSISHSPSSTPTRFPSSVPSATREPSQSTSPSSVPSVSPKPSTSQSQFPSWQVGTLSDQPSLLV